MPAERPRILPTRLLHEAVSGIAQRMSRSIFTIIGVALGVGSFIAVLGVAATANGQIGRNFDAQLTTRVVVAPTDGVALDSRGNVFPLDAEARAKKIDGVVAAASTWDVSVRVTRILPSGFASIDDGSVRVLAAGPDLWDLAEPEIASGRVFDEAIADLPVAVVGKRIAEALHLGDVSAQPTIYLDGHPFTVVGTLAATTGESAPLAAVTIPSAVARRTFGEPGIGQSLRILTRTGAAPMVGAQLALALDPVHPEFYAVTAPEPQHELRGQVTASLQALFLALALICIVVGAVGITNSTLVGVLARTSEIGIRRALGALPHHIAAQFLIEAALLGVMGGISGAWIGLLTVVLVALAQQWTAVVPLWGIGGAPLVGALIGVVAGLYPAVRAARIEPTEAFRR